MLYKICNVCDVTHYINCPDCFGFGFKPDGSVFTAIEAIEGTNIWGDPIDNTKYIACKTCGSTIKGIPDWDLNYDKSRLWKMEEDFSEEPLRDDEFNSWNNDPGYF